jgi:IS5 family transposase
MPTKARVQNVSSRGLETYEGSYFDIYAHLDYKFLPFRDQVPTKRRGRPSFPRNALFKACLLRFLMPEGSFRMVEAYLNANPDLAGIMGFQKDRIPSDSTLKMFFQNLTASRLRTSYKWLARRLLAENVIDPTLVALDSAPLEVRWKPKTKRNPTPFDPDARWGFAKSKDLYYFGYKAHVVIDSKSGLPFAGTLTPANVSDMKTLGAFIELLKELDAHPEFVLGDKGYDSTENHRRVRENLGAVALFAINPRGRKKTTCKKTPKIHWDGTVQLTLDKFIPRKKRAKKYRKECERILKTPEGKKVFAKRSAVERTLAWLKENLKLERIEFAGFKQVLKHFLMKCIVMLVNAATAVKIGAPEAIRSARYFQR